MSMKANPKTIYLDHAATTPLDKTVAKEMIKVMTNVYGNPSSLYDVGRQAQAVLTEARLSVAKSLEVEAPEIIFTGSGTESDNLALLGVARAYQSKGKHIIVSNIEHKAVLASAYQLEQEGFSVTYLPVNKLGLVDVEVCLKAIRPETILISIMYANNEIGTIQPIAEIARRLALLGNQMERPLFHTDACQAAGYLPLSPKKLGVDLLTINGSKIYGPKGIGVLWIRSGIRLKPIIVGGDQEFGKRAGTENVALAVGMAKALERVLENQTEAALQVRTLRDYFAGQLSLVSPHIFINGDLKQRLPNNLHITVPNIEGESLILRLNEYGICCSTGSACSALDLKPSHVLLAIGIANDFIHGSLRFTLGKATTKKDIDKTIIALRESIAQLLAITATPAMRRR